MRFIRVAVMLGAACVAGCASEKAARELQLADLQRDLPGVYRAEAADSTASLTIVPVRARFVGESVFYFEWLASDSSAAETGLLSLEAVEGADVIPRRFEFVDPPRWREALASPELFLALVPHDVRGTGRCELKFEEAAARLQYACGNTKLPLRRVR
jgi:hypothetical protein